MEVRATQVLNDFFLLTTKPIQLAPDTQTTEEEKNLSAKSYLRDKVKR